jgi:hypothetical protein
MGGEPSVPVAAHSEMDRNADLGLGRELAAK